MPGFDRSCRRWPGHRQAGQSGALGLSQHQVPGLRFQPDAWIPGAGGNPSAHGTRAATRGRAQPHLLFPSVPRSRGQPWGPGSEDGAHVQPAGPCAPRSVLRRESRSQGRRGRGVLPSPRPGGLDSTRDLSAPPQGPHAVAAWGASGFPRRKPLGIKSWVQTPDPKSAQTPPGPSTQPRRGRGSNTAPSPAG